MNKLTDLAKKQEIALEQGKAFTKALNLMKKIDSNVDAETEEYLLTLACEEAEGMYKVQPEGDLLWNIPKKGENVHIEIVVRDKEDLRFIPQLSVYINVFDKNGNEVVSSELPFLWHPFLFHYGADVHLPEDGRYNAEVKIERPDFGRHDENKGKRYEKSIKSKFPTINITTGRKEYGPE